VANLCVNSPENYVSFTNLRPLKESFQRAQLVTADVMRVLGCCHSDILRLTEALR
jgi:hypothetical protein